jgi:hypothetical protein
MYIDYNKIIMSTQNNLIIVSGSVKQRGAQIYILIILYKSRLNEIHKTKPSQIELNQTKPN